MNLRSEKTLDFRGTKRACFFAYVAMSSVFSLPPMLFVTFHEMYGISYTLLGTLILINFCTQLAIDLVFTFFSKHFNIRLTVCIMPLLTATGLLIYALVPYFCPDKAIIGLFTGTVIFSVAAGLCEVLISPIVAAVPSQHPDRDMSLLHSLYGWGVFGVVMISSLYFRIFGTENWTFLALFWAVLPVIGSVLFFTSPIPDTEIGGTANKKTGNKSRYILLCAVCIFLGSSAENIMTGWISSYMEKALNIPKSVGDIFGMAAFALLLAGSRFLYAKLGKNITKTLLISMAGASVCYLVAGLSPSVALSFFACILTGCFTAMLWPGTLILMEEKVPTPGVAAYALMAACGDMGASLAPQAVGLIVDKVSVGSYAAGLLAEKAIPLETTGLKIGMLCSAVFPVLGLVWILYIRTYSKKHDR